MLLEAWLFVGVVAVLVTGAALVTPDDGMAIVTGVAGLIAWGVWTFGTVEIHRPIQGNPELTFAEPALTLLGIALALVPAWIAITGPVELVSRYRDGRVEEI